MQCCPNTLIYIKKNFFLHLVRNISEAVTQMCSVKKMQLQISQIHRKIPVLESLIKNETLTQVFSCEFCEISNNKFSYRTPPVAPSDTSTFLIQDLKMFCPWKMIKNIYEINQHWTGNYTMKCGPNKLIYIRALS